MHELRFRCAISAAIVMGSCVALPVAAEPINHGDFTGASVAYLAVTEETITPGDIEELFGLPSVISDTLDFQPAEFLAFTQAGGADLTGSSLSLRIEALPNRSIASLDFSEAGNTGLIGVGDDNTMTSVFTQVLVDVLAVDGVPSPPVNLTTNMTFSPSSGDFGLFTDGGGGPAFNQQWLGTLFVDVKQLLIERSVPHQFGATMIQITLESQLFAFSEAVTSASIDRNSFRIVAATQPMASLDGDFNVDGAVDAADYVVWRNGLGTIYTPEHYELWRANFGRPNAAATALAGSDFFSRTFENVPEPATGLMLAAIAGWLALKPGRRGRP